LGVFRLYTTINLISGEYAATTNNAGLHGPDSLWNDPLRIV
jgi:hypothetical protein